MLYIIPEMGVVGVPGSVSFISGLSIKAFIYFSIHARS
jgi:hypothetical protein